MHEPASGDDLTNRWMQLVGLTGLEFLRRRMQWEGAATHDLAAVLQSRTAVDEGRFGVLQNWLRSSPPIVDDGGPVSASTPFFELWRPIASGAMGELCDGLPPGVLEHFALGSPDGAGLRASLSAALVARLSEVGEAALWQRFNADRQPEQIIFAHLAAASGEDRTIRRAIYSRVLEEMRADGLTQLVQEYPVLAQHISAVTDQWISNCGNVLRRVFDDWLLLLHRFDLPFDARVVDLKLNLSDPHRGGQTVAIVAIATAGEQRWVVYKPKDLSMDRAFQALLRELPSPRHGDVALKAATVITRSGYGYMEFIPHRPCTDDAQLRAFYRNAGRLTAILYILGCTDCHHENLIACGDQLCFVDAETLLTGGSPHDTADLNTRVANSVTALGILPQWYLFGKQRIARDVSALGIEPPEGETQSVRGWININTDAMIGGVLQRPSRVPTSLPVGVGGRNRLSEFMDDFCGGFADQLSSVIDRKSDWLVEDGHLGRFAGAMRRVVIRPTWIYAWLRKRQLEPPSLLSQQNQRLTLETLSRTYLLNAERSSGRPLFDAEAEQMERLDIPFFEMSVDSTNFPIGGASEITDFVAVTGREQTRCKIEKLDAEAVDFQVALIRGANMAKTHLVRSAPRISRPGRALAGGPPPNPLAEAERLGDRLIEASVSYGEGSVEWLGIDILDDPEKFRFGPLGPSLYGGRMGIALFLAALSRQDLRGSDAYRRMAVRACADVYTLLDSNPTRQELWWRERTLGIAGAGGILLALMEVSDLLPELGLPEGVDALLRSCDDGILHADHQLDIVYGCAGLIGPLIRVGSPTALQLAGTAGDRLVGQEDDAGGGWRTMDDISRPLTGFSHGASGIAAALTALHGMSEKPIHRDAAQRAMRYERAAFDPRHGNWPDFRGRRGGDPRFMLSWCHGAPGIALSRICVDTHEASDPEVRDEIRHALAATTAPTGAAAESDSLCCGSFGRAAILRLAASHLRDNRWLASAQALETEALTAATTNGSYASVNSFGLLPGLAGIGLALIEGARDGRARTETLPTILSAGLYRRWP